MTALSQFANGRTKNQKFNLENLLIQFIKTGVFIILFLPLYVNPNFLFPLVFPRTAIFRLIIEFCLIGYILRLALNPKFRPKRAILTWLLSTFVLMMIISSVFGVNFYRSFWSSIERTEGILTWLHYLAFFIILIGIFKTKAEWQQLLNVVLISSFFQTLYALAQLFNLSPALKTAGERLGGAIGNPSFLAAYLIFIIFLAAYLFFQTQIKGQKILYAGLMIIDLLIIWQTQTRGAVIALIFGGLFILFSAFLKTKKIALKISAAVLLIFMAMTFFYLYLNRSQPWAQNLTTVNRLINISPTDVTPQNRLLVWQVGGQAFLARPIFGWGWENFNAAFNQHFNPALARDIGSQPWYDRAHNVIVEVGVTTGLVGLITYLLIIIFAVKKIWEKKLEFKTNLILTTLILTYLAQNIFVFDTLNSYLLFFLTLAFIQTRPNFEKNEKLETLGKNQLRSWHIILLMVALIIFGSLGYWFNVRPALANHYTVAAVTKDKTNPILIKNDFVKAFNYSNPAQSELRFILVQATRDRVNLSGINQETLPLINFAINEMKKNISTTPYEIQNYLLLGELYLATNQLNPNYLIAAEEISQKALAISPKRYQTLTLLGRIKMSQAKFDEGIAYFQKAIDLNPKFAEAHWNLAIAYILSRQADLAYQSLEKTLALGFPVYQPENVAKLLSAYRDSKDLKATIDFLASIVKRSPNNADYQNMLDELNQLYQKAIENK